MTTTPSEPTEPTADDKPRTVRVPVRLGDGVFTHDETTKVDAEHARQWDARLWSDKPPI